MSKGPAPGFKSRPGHRVETLISPKRVRASAAGVVIADTRRARLLRETRHTPVYYFPREDVRTGEFLTPNDHSTFCPFKGRASHWDMKAGDRVIGNAAWAYEDPWDECLPLKGLMAFYWNKMDTWFEDDEQVFVHARDPFVRLDVLRNRAPLRIVHDGRELANSSDYLVLYETALIPRHYIPRNDVNLDLMTAGGRETQCPYKGRARYWSAPGAGGEDIAWSYEEPQPEAGRIRNHICFYQERVDLLEINGEAIEKPESRWARGWRLAP